MPARHLAPVRVDLFNLELAFFHCASAAWQVTAAVRSLLRPAGSPGLLCCFTVSHWSTQGLALPS